MPQPLASQFFDYTLTQSDIDSIKAQGFNTTTSAGATVRACWWSMTQLKVYLERGVSCMLSKQRDDVH